MDTGYVKRKEIAEGGSAFIMIMANTSLVKTLLYSDDCGKEAKCVVPVVFLFLSIVLHVVLGVMVFILARREKSNADLRKLIEDTANTNGSGIEESKTDVQSRNDDKKKLEDKEKANDRLNDAVLALTFIGIAMNIVINGIQLRQIKNVAA